MPNIRVTEPVGATDIASTGQNSWQGFIGAAKRWTRITALTPASMPRNILQRETARSCGRGHSSSNFDEFDYESYRNLQIRHRSVRR